MEEVRSNGVVDIDDDESIKRAHYYYNEKVVPHYKKEFETYGATDKERVKAIECKIREHILNIIQTLPDTSREIRSFIDAYKEELIQGEEAKEVENKPLKEVRSYLG